MISPRQLNRAWALAAVRLVHHLGVTRLDCVKHCAVHHSGARSRDNLDLLLRPVFGSALDSNVRPTERALHIDLWSHRSELTWTSNWFQLQWRQRQSPSTGPVESMLRRDCKV